MPSLTDRSLSLTVLSLLFVLYVAISPLYWFVGVNQMSALAVKTLLLSCLAGLAGVLYFASGSRNIHINYLFFVIMVLVFISEVAVSLIHGEMTNFFSVAALLLCALGGVLASYIGFLRVIHLLRYAAYLFAVLVSLLLIDYWTGPRIYHPSLTIPAYMTGFHGGRTGWTFVLGFFLAVLLSSGSDRLNVFNIPAICILVMGVFISGSKGGMLVTILLFTLFLYERFGLRGALILVVGALLCYVSFDVLKVFLADSEHRVIAAIFSDGAGDDITTGRAAGYGIGLEQFAMSPFYGVGSIDLKQLGLGYSSIHNVWIRYLAETGLIGTIPIILLCGMLSKLCVRASIAGVRYPIYFMIAAILPTIYEPVAIFGSFFSSGMFWLAIGFLLVEVRPRKSALEPSLNRSDWSYSEK